MNKVTSKRTMTIATYQKKGPFFGLARLKNGLLETMIIIINYFFSNSKNIYFKTKK
jgi:hypothetical protein